MSLGDNRPTALIQQYGMLYSQARMDTMDSLDLMPELDDLENLKNKLLLSVIVVSWAPLLPARCRQLDASLPTRCQFTAMCPASVQQNII